MTWYRLELKEGSDPDIESAWRAAWQVAHEDDQPNPAHGIFRATNLGKSAILYFSPMEEALADSFGAKPCAKPASAGLQLLAGHARAFETHFPDAVPTPVNKAGSTKASPFFQPSKLRRAFAPTLPLDPAQPSQPAGL